MKFKKIMAMALSCAMIASFAAGCGGGNDAPATTDGGASANTGDTIKVGGLAPLTGEVSIYGIACNNGIKLAIDEVNAAGGVLGFAVYVCGLWLGLREKSGPGLYLVPAVNLAWFFRKVAACIEPARLIVAAAILGIWLAAVQLLLYGEFAAAGIAALVSWSGAAADSLLRRS